MPETVGPKRFYMSLRRATHTHTHSMAHTLTTKSDPEIDINT